MSVCARCGARTRAGEKCKACAKTVVYTAEGKASTWYVTKHPKGYMVTSGTAADGDRVIGHSKLENAKKCADRLAARAYLK